MKPLGWIVAAAAALLLAAPAAAQTVTAKTVAACGTPGNTPVVGNPYPITQDPTGKLCMDGAGGGGATVTATAVAPTYVEGSEDNPISSDLHGSQRVTILDEAGAAVDWTAPVPVTQSTSPWVTSLSTAIPAGANTIGSIANTGFVATGPTADDAAATGNPAQVAGKFTATAPTFADGDTAQLRLTAKGNLIIGGATADNAASPAEADSYPAFVGGVNRSTLPTYADGDRVGWQFGTRGSANVTLYGANSANSIIAGDNNSDTVAPSGTANKLGVLGFNYALGATNFERVRTIAGSFGAATGVVAVEQAGAPYVRMSTATTTTVKSGAGILHKIVINTLAAGTITVYDNTAGSGTIIAVINSGAERAIQYDLAFATGLTVVTSATPDITIVYR